MRIGTSHFVTRARALSYYGCDAAAVDQKLAEGSIHIGPPTLQPGDRLRVDEDGRYEIVTVQRE